MSRLKYFNDPILKRKNKDITLFDDHLKKIVLDMFYIMYNDCGVGLAAPQIGENINLFVIDEFSFPKENEKHEPMIFINPKLTCDEDNTSIEDEGCLSFPGAIIPMKRSLNIRVDYMDIHGLPQTLDSQGWQARIIQHEYDHLLGKTLGDFISNIEKSILRKKIKERKPIFSMEDIREKLHANKNFETWK